MQFKTYSLEPNSAITFLILGELMITVTLGTIPYPFDRAIHWLSSLLEEELITEPVFLQYGVTDISAIADNSLITALPLLPGRELAAHIEASRLVISHAGQGSTRKLAIQDKSFVVLPRLAQHGEHVDDHQLMFAEGVEKLGVTVCRTLEDLKTAINQPPPSLQKDLFAGEKLGDFLAEKYSQESVTSTPKTYASQEA